MSNLMGWISAVLLRNTFLVLYMGLWVTLVTATPNHHRHPHLQRLSHRLSTQIVTSEQSESDPSTMYYLNFEDGASKIPDFQGDNPRSYKQWKQEMLGTPEGIQHLRKHYGPHGMTKAKSDHEVTHGSEAIRKANDHILRIKRDYYCHLPRPKVISIQSIYSHPGVLYMPSHTVLHRCGDDTGCCSSSSQACVKKESEDIQLYFYVWSITNGTQVYRLAFTNDTECHCQDRNLYTEMMPRDQFSMTPPTPSTTTTVTSPPTTSSFDKCVCTSLFAPKLDKEGNCTCDCFHQQKECIRQKRGREHLNFADRSCIATEKCTMPDCEFGGFISKAGRCPKKIDIFFNQNINGERRR